MKHRIALLIALAISASALVVLPTAASAATAVPTALTVNDCSIHVYAPNTFNNVDFFGTGNVPCGRAHNTIELKVCIDNGSGAHLACNQFGYPGDNVSYLTGYSPNVQLAYGTWTRTSERADISFGATVYSYTYSSQFCQARINCSGQ
jgi:hypothetical protein